MKQPDPRLTTFVVVGLVGASLLNSINIWLATRDIRELQAKASRGQLSDDNFWTRR